MIFEDTNNFAAQGALISDNVQRLRHTPHSHSPLPYPAQRSHILIQADNPLFCVIAQQSSRSPQRLQPNVNYCKY